MSEQSQVTHQVISIDDLVENPENVNAMDDAAFNALCEGIQESGFVPTIVVAPLGDERYVILDGNHRYRAARLLGFEVLNCDVIEGMTDSDVQSVLSARIAVTRGQVNKVRMTSLWLRVRAKFDERTSMHMLGITSEKQLHSLVNVAKRKTDAKTMASEATAVMVQRAKVVDDLSTVVRAAYGDGAGRGEFAYTVFQSHGSDILLLRCTSQELGMLRRAVDALEDTRVSVVGGIVEAIATLLRLEDDDFEDDEEVGSQSELTYGDTRDA